MPDNTEQRPDWRDRPIYWWIVAGLVTAIAAVIGLMIWVDHSVSRDIPYPEITETGVIVFNCDPDHRVGAQVWVKTDAPPKNYPIIEGRACYDFSKGRWYLKSREQYVPPGK